MGRAFAEVCKFVDCFPSELYKKHDPTISDFVFVAVMKTIEDEELEERLGGSGGGNPIPSGNKMIMPHMSTKGR